MGMIQARDDWFESTFFSPKTMYPLAGISRDLYVGNSYYFCKTTTHHKGYEALIIASLSNTLKAHLCNNFT